MEIFDNLKIMQDLILQSIRSEELKCVLHAKYTDPVINCQVYLPA